MAGSGWVGSMEMLKSGQRVFQDSDNYVMVGTLSRIIKGNLGWKTVFTEIESYPLTKTGFVV